MIDLPRRRLLQAGLTSGAAALLPSIARAAAIAPDRRSGTLEDLQHVVILMQENRAFDHYFGALPGVRGFGDRFPIPAPPLPNAPARTVWLQPSEDGRQWLTPFALDTAAQFGVMRVNGTRIAGRMHSGPGTMAGSGIGPRPSTIMRWAITRARIFRFSTRSPRRLPSAMPSTLRSRPAPIPTVCFVDRRQRSAGPRGRPGDWQFARQFSGTGRVCRAVSLSHLCRSTAERRCVMADLSGHGRQLHRQPAGGVCAVSTGLQCRTST